MVKYKDTKWAKQILELQNEDGGWGFFHSLSNPTSKQQVTTEQALRRLRIIGFTIKDEPIQRAVEYMHDCLSGKREFPDRREKLHDFDIFKNMILAAWIRRFTYEDKLANIVAEQWIDIIQEAFKDGEYNHSVYTQTYKKNFHLLPKGGRLVDFVSFYQVSLLSRGLDREIEPKVIKYILNKDDGIYYIFSRALTILPQEFRSKEANLYLGAIELLAEYQNPKSKKQLVFAKDWLLNNQMNDGIWDMGIMAKNNIYLPLSDSWRKADARKEDCTYRIKMLLDKLNR